MESPDNRELLIRYLDRQRLDLADMPWYTNLEKDSRFASVDYEISKIDVNGIFYLFGYIHLIFYLNSVEAISFFVLKHEETLNKLSMHD